MLIFAILAVAVVIVDQVSKYFVSVNLPEVGDTFPVIKDVLHLTRVNNEGAAFGILSSHRWVFMVLSVVAIIGLTVWAAVFISKRDNKWMMTAAAFVVGGGIGNMIDRIRIGYVIDFIDCRFINFYVFNVADSFVTIGCILLIISLIIEEIREFKRRRAALVDTDEGEDDGSV